MSRYKITKVKDGFSVWKMKDFGNGYAWTDTGSKFRTKREARIFIDIEKEGERNDEYKRKGS